MVDSQSKFTSFPPPPEWVRAKEWTPEQQEMELYRRALHTQTMMNSGSLKYTPRPDDVLLAIPAKSGTTWLAHICHQLRMGGSEPDFEDQERVVVFLDLIEMMGISDPNTVPQCAHPRLFATHKPYSEVPKGARMITCFREPCDMILSTYRFVDTIISLKGRVALPLFCAGYIKTSLKDVFNSLVDWWEHRHDQDILFFLFDDLKENHIGCVRRIAKFIGVDCNEEVLSRVVFTTTHAEMYRHHSKFDSHFITKIIADIVGDDPPAESVGRVRKDGGNIGEGKQALSQELKQQVDEQWTEIITAKLGFKNYEELVQAWKNERDF